MRAYLVLKVPKSLFSFRPVSFLSGVLKKGHPADSEEGKIETLRLLRTLVNPV